jgi:hypothetical protein
MDEERARQDRAAVTAGLNDQNTLAQLSSSGNRAQSARPNAMARHAAGAVEASLQEREGSQGGNGGQGAGDGNGGTGQGQ